jgi:peptidoglycan pentaglycine glycine transferase (the first glycine)
MASEFKIFHYEDGEKNIWDDFVIKNSRGSIHQISAWKNLQEKIPGRGEVLGFGVKDASGKIRATTFCVRMETGWKGQFWYYSARGPVFQDTDFLAANYLINATAKVLHNRGGIFWRLDPSLPSQNPFKIETPYPIAPATQQYQPTDTLQIDLRMETSEIFSQMKQRGRRGIRKAEKSGIEIQALCDEEIQPKDLQDFYSLNKATTDRDGFSSHESDYYEKFLKKLAPHAVLFFATYEGKRIATAITTFLGPHAIYYFGASTSDPRLNQYKAPSLLQWHMIQEAKERGCLSYDFLGIAPIDEPDHAYAGISQFKHGFGGERKTYQPGQEIILDKKKYHLYKLAKSLQKLKQKTRSIFH